MSTEKRTNKNGKTYYYDTVKKQFSTPKKYIKDNLTKIQNKTIKYSELSTKEKRSFNAQNVIRYKGKIVKKEIANAVIRKYNKAMKGTEFPKIKKGDDLSNFFPNDLNPLEMIKTDKRTTFIENHKKSRTYSNLFSMQSDLAEKFKSGSLVVVIKESGEKLFGFEATEYISEFESRKRKEASEGENLIFIYERFEYVNEKGENVFEIDLSSTMIESSQI